MGRFLFCRLCRISAALNQLCAPLAHHCASNLQPSTATKGRTPPPKAPAGAFLLYTGVAGGLLHVMVSFEFELRDRLDVGALAFPGDRSV